TATMMSQLRLVCHDLSGVNHDPSLSQEDNQQLQSDIFSEILRVCERLCLHYIHLRDVLRKRGVFGDQANRSRLCAQMTLDCAKQIEEEIGELNLECVYDLIPCHLEETTHRKQGCQSMPELEQGSLLEELGLEPPPSRAPSPVVLLGLEPSSCREKEPISAAEDLREIDLEMDLPALISALPRSGSSKLHLLRQTLQKFTEEEEDHGTAKSAVMEEPLHPQPVAVSVSLTPKSIARTAPPRVSDRVFTETVKLHMYPPVYSHLTGEKPHKVTSGTNDSRQHWSKSHLSVDDYMKYISNQRLDYLGEVFHLHDSDDSDEEENRKRKALAQHEEKRQSQKIDSQKRIKEEFAAGVWNVNSGLLGGLGNESLPNDQLQVCLERIWKALSFPSSQRLEMAIKYSSPSYQSRLKEAITAWERTAKLIQQRETLLAQLEMFERGASDPSRFFQHF
uniref:Uncharacterized protein n=1 Tax=Paramormyrops kingsleyae TaxID=1676925 RepID=A0A3B3RUR6_9TELE